jgi:hypothetical protein
MPGSSPTARGRIEFVSYGLVVHFPLLSTPPRGDAVMFSFGPGFVGPERTRTSLIPRAPARTGTGVPPVNRDVAWGVTTGPGRGSACSVCLLCVPLDANRTQR